MTEAMVKVKAGNGGWVGHRLNNGDGPLYFNGGAVMIKHDYSGAVEVWKLSGKRLKSGQRMEVGPGCDRCYDIGGLKVRVVHKK